MTTFSSTGPGAQACCGGCRTESFNNLRRRWVPPRAPCGCEVLFFPVSLSLSLSFYPSLPRTHAHTHTHTLTLTLTLTRPRARTHTYTHAHTHTTNTPIQRHLDTTSSRKPLLLRFQKARHYREKIYGVYGKNMSCRRAVAQTIPACHHTSRTDECSCLCLACATPRLLVSRQSQVYLWRPREPKFKKKSTPSLKRQSTFASTISMFLFSKERRSLTHSSPPGAEK